MGGDQPRVAKPGVLADGGDSWRVIWRGRISSPGESLRSNADDEAWE